MFATITNDSDIIGEGTPAKISSANEQASTFGAVDEAVMASREQQVNTFVETATPSITRPYSEISVPSPYPTETITEWLSRPVSLGTYTWSKDEAVGDNLAEFSFPGAMYNFQTLEEKLKHFRFLRASIRLVVRMNGTRSHYGRILMHWIPFAKNNPEHQLRTSNIYSATGYPHVIISPTGGDVCEVVVPFISPYLYMRANKGFIGTGVQQRDVYEFGVARVSVLNVLQNTAGDSPVSFTVYANFENVQVAGYTSYQSVPQAGGTSIDRLPIEKCKNPVSRKQLRYVAQAGRSTRGKTLTNMQTTGNPAQAAEAATKAVKGTTSSMLEKVGSVAAQFSQMPGVGQVASIVSPIAYGLSSIAQAFGYNKPDTLQSTRPVINRYLDTATTHGEDTSTKLAILPDNYVADGMSFMGNNSEMDFDTICSKPMLVDILEWGSDVTTGSVIKYYPLTPLLTHREDEGGVTTVFPTYLSWITRAFEYWRGDLRFHIQVTSSAFHSGRLAFSYEPENYSLAGEDAEVENTVTRIVDIQTDTEISFTIPYLAITPYLPAIDEVYSTPGRGWIGQLMVKVINPLTSSQFPVLPIYLNVWLSGTNMQFGVPLAPRFDYRLADVTNESDNEPRYVAQAGFSHSIQDIDYPPLIQATSHRVDGLCFGENCNSVRDLITRPTPMLNVLYREVRDGIDNPGAFCTYVIDTWTGPGYKEFSVSPYIPPGRYYYTINFDFEAGNSDVHSYLVAELRGQFGTPVIKLAPLVPEDGNAKTGSVSGYFRVYPGSKWLDRFRLEPKAGASIQQDCAFTLYLTSIEGESRPIVNIDIFEPILTRYDRIAPGENEDEYEAIVPSYLSYFQAIFRFWRGSIRYKLFESVSTFGSTKIAHLKHNKAENSDGYKVTRLIQANDTARMPLPELQDSFHHGLTSVRDPVSNALEATVPYYYNTMCKLTGAYDTAAGRYPLFSRDAIRFVLMHEDYNIPPRLEAQVLASAGDDFEFGFLVPPPKFNITTS